MRAFFVKPTEGQWQIALPADLKKHQRTLTVLCVPVSADDAVLLKVVQAIDPAAPFVTYGELTHEA